MKNEESKTVKPSASDKAKYEGLVKEYTRQRFIFNKVFGWGLFAAITLLVALVVCLIIFLTSQGDIRQGGLIGLIVCAIVTVMAITVTNIAYYLKKKCSNRVVHYKSLLYIIDLEENGVKDEKSGPILQVKHLKQFFKLGRGMKTKAVNNVSFDLQYGEVLGLVGESGCGKTTTGRSIIKLYDITGGEVIFKDQVISAGVRWNQKEIKYTNIRAKSKIKSLKQDCARDLEDAEEAQAQQIRDHYDEEIKKVQENADAIISYQSERIREHRYDNAYGAKEYGRRKSLFLKAELEYRLSKASDEEKPAIEEEYRKKIHDVTHNRLMTKMQMIFQDPISSLNPRMTVYDIIAEGLRIQGIKDKEVIDEKVYSVLKRVGLLPEHATRYPHEFSGGQRQRIGIARAVIMNPELIIADEPVSALDVSIQAQVINLLNDVRKEMGLSIIFIAHDLSVVKYFCDRIAVMYFGKIVELTTSEELFRHPLHPYTKSLISAIPLPDPHYEQHRVRITYNPAAVHDYSVSKPRLQEILPGHFVQCNDEEFEKYRQEIAELDAKREEEAKKGDESLDNAD